MKDLWARLSGWVRKEKGRRKREEKRAKEVRAKIATQPKGQAGLSKVRLGKKEARKTSENEKRSDERTVFRNPRRVREE